MPQTFVFTIRVYYEDTDAGGIVYYANYLKFFERARTEWLRALGVEQDQLARCDGLIFVVRSANMEFLKPARFNDVVEVATSISVLRGASVTFAQAIRRLCGVSGETICQGEVRVACIDAVTLVPRALPPVLAQRLKEVCL